MYYRVPITNGVLDIDYSTLIHAVTISDTEAYVLLSDHNKRDSWIEITEEQFNAVKPPEPTPEPQVNEIDQMKSDIATMQETINFLLGL
jgi:hypothetical protein